MEKWGTSNWGIHIDFISCTIYLRPGRADENMNLQSKISKILEGEFSNYYTEREEIEEATAQLLALFEKEMRGIIGKKYSLYQRFSIPLNHFRHSQRTKLAKVMEGKHE